MYHGLKMASQLFCATIIAFTATISPAKAIEQSHVNMWLEDINYYQQQLPQLHLNLFHTTTREQFNQSLAQLKQDLPVLSEWQIILRLMKITRAVNDGHTSVPLWGLEYQAFPLRFNVIDGEMVVIAASERWQSLVGMRLTAVNSYDVQDVFLALAPLVPFVENQYSLKVRVAQAVSNGSLLQALGMVTDTAKTVFHFEDHKHIKHHVTLSTVSSKILELNEEHSLSEVQPQHFFTQLSEHQFPQKTIWAGVNSKGDSLYLGIKKYPDFQQAMDMGSALVRLMKQYSTRRLVIDFRQSYGGNLYVGLLLSSFLNQSDSVDWLDQVYVLISNKTFSAAMSNAAQFKQLLNAKWVGQPSGASPNGYQDMGQFNLPNSHLLITYSKRYYQFDQTQGEQLKPDVNINVSWQDVLQNKDAVLQWVMQTE